MRSVAVRMQKQKMKEEEQEKEADRVLMERDGEKVAREKAMWWTLAHIDGS
jgi:hypothetical protein